MNIINIEKLKKDKQTSYKPNTIEWDELSAGINDKFKELGFIGVLKAYKHNRKIGDHPTTKN
ncbi:MAG: hypothetical protein KKB65_01715 [Nanoarchaeota archaeon]|nr:hypothetical protein [Nanoarchaeota archaeon]